MAAALARSVRVAQVQLAARQQRRESCCGEVDVGNVEQNVDDRQVGELPDFDTHSLSQHKLTLAREHALQ
jgi:hypothetical protein